MPVTRIRSIVLVPLLLASATGALSAQNLQERIDSYLETQLRTNGIPGLNVAVVRDGKVVYSGAHGVRELGKDEPLTPDNVFHFASVSKTFTAAAIVQLVEKGQLNLDDPVKKYLPYFQLADERLPGVTIRLAMNHTAGLPPWKDLDWAHPQYDEGAAERHLRSLAEEKLLWDPGSHYRYTDTDADLLGEVVTKVSGMPFEEYVRKNIFEPLGMIHSSFIYPEIDKALRTTGHMGNPASPSTIYPYSRPHAPSSTLNSSVVDMSRWLIANLNRGEIDGHRILKPESYKLLWTPSTKLDIQSHFNGYQRDHFRYYAPMTHGLFWYLGELDGHRVVFHAGGDTGFRSFEILLPDDQIGVVVASNWYETDTPKLAAELVRLFLSSDDK